MYEFAYWNINNNSVSILVCVKLCDNALPVIIELFQYKFDKVSVLTYINH